MNIANVWLRKDPPPNDCYHLRIRLDQAIAVTTKTRHACHSKITWQFSSCSFIYLFQSWLISNGLFVLFFTDRILFWAVVLVFFTSSLPVWSPRPAPTTIRGSRIGHQAISWLPAWWVPSQLHRINPRGWTAEGKPHQKKRFTITRAPISDT